MRNRMKAKDSFADRLVELTNEYSTVLSIEDVAEVYAEQGCHILDYLAWKPHSQRAAYEHFVSALACVRDGRVIPVPNFELHFSDHLNEPAAHFAGAPLN